jgi:hypothetical protein
MVKFPRNLYAEKRKTRLEDAVGMIFFNSLRTDNVAVDAVHAADAAQRLEREHKKIGRLAKTPRFH